MELLTTCFLWNTTQNNININHQPPGLDTTPSVCNNSESSFWSQEENLLKDSKTKSEKKNTLKQAEGLKVFIQDRMFLSAGGNLHIHVTFLNER